MKITIESQQTAVTIEDLNLQEVLEVITQLVSLEVIESSFELDEETESILEEEYTEKETKAKKIEDIGNDIFTTMLDSLLSNPEEAAKQKAYAKEYPIDDALAKVISEILSK